MAMQWRNTASSYGLVAIGLHWSIALIIIGLFSLGLWMVDLGYYDPWYKRAPELHKSIGMLLFGLMVARTVWRLTNTVPAPEPGLSARDRRLAAAAHHALYLLPFATMLAGYFISTADGRPIEVFGLFSVPATISHLPHQEDVAGAIHLTLAIALVALAGLHASAGLRHHIVDRDRTLLRMLKPSSQPQPRSTQENHR